MCAHIESRSSGIGGKVNSCRIRFWKMDESLRSKHDELCLGAGGDVEG